MSRIDHIINRKMERERKPTWSKLQARYFIRPHRQGSRWWRNRMADLYEQRLGGRERQPRARRQVAEPRAIAIAPERKDYDSRQLFRAATRAHTKYVGKMTRIQGPQP